MAEACNDPAAIEGMLQFGVGGPWGGGGNADSFSGTDASLLNSNANESTDKSLMAQATANHHFGS